MHPFQGQRHYGPTAVNADPTHHPLAALVENALYGYFVPRVLTHARFHVPSQFASTAKTAKAAQHVKSKNAISRIAISGLTG